MLPWTGRDGASAELRGYNVSSALRALGWRTTLVPAQLELVQRLRIIRAERPDVILMQKSRHPLNRPSLYSASPVVFDIDDADFADAAMAPSVEQCCRESVSVVAGSSYVAEWCRQFNSNVNVVWTGSNDRPRGSVVPAGSRRRIVGWAHSSPAGYPLERTFLCSVIRELRRRSVEFEFWMWGVEREAEITDLTSVLRELRVPSRCFRRMPYSEFVTSLTDLAVGLQPVCLQNAFSRGKSFGKVLAYFVAGVPVVASNNVDHPYVIANGRSGMLADSVEEWADAISHLLDNPEARTAMAEAGLETYNSNLTTAAVARKLDPILRASMRPRRATPG